MSNTPITGIKYHIPIQTVSEQNRRDHWAKRYKRNKNQKQAAYVCTYKALHNTKFEYKGKTLCIEIVAIRKRFFDGDNNVAGCKGIRDGIAQALGRDDGDSSLTWTYNQTKATKDHVFGLLVEIREYKSPETWRPK